MNGAGLGREGYEGGEGNMVEWRGAEIRGSEDLSIGTDGRMGGEMAIM